MDQPQISVDDLTDWFLANRDELGGAMAALTAVASKVDQDDVRALLRVQAAMRTIVLESQRIGNRRRTVAHSRIVPWED